MQDGDSDSKIDEPIRSDVGFVGKASNSDVVLGTKSDNNMNQNNGDFFKNIVDKGFAPLDEVL